MKKLLLSLMTLVLTTANIYADGFKITSSDPAAGECAGIAKSSYWTFTTNMDADASFVGARYTFTDETTNQVLYTYDITKASNYNAISGYPNVWAVKNYSANLVDFKKGHTITLTIAAYDNKNISQGTCLGTDAITFIGAGSSEYVYSPATLVSVTPETGTELLSSNANTFVLTFSQGVRIDKSNSLIVIGQSQTESFKSITANADSTVWTIVVKPSTIESTSPQLYINVYAKDMNGLTLEGNTSGAYQQEGKSYYKLKYVCYLGSPSLVVEPAAGQVTSLKDFKVSYKGGMALSYAAGVADLTVTNAAGEVVATIPYANKETAYTVDPKNNLYVTFSLPTEITTPGKYTLNIPSKMFALGTEFDGYTSKVQTVEYTIAGELLQVTSVDPADKAELAQIPELLTVNFSNADAVAAAQWYVVDNNYTNENDSIVFGPCDFTKADGTFTSRAGYYVTVKLYTGHTYTLKIKTWGSVDDYNYGNPASAQFAPATWTGTIAPFVYSDVTYVSTNPADQSTITSGDFTVTFSDAVASVKANVNGGFSANPICTVAAGNDGNKTWNITIPESVIKDATGTLNINIIAQDANGKYIKGNQNTDIDTTYQVNFNCYEGAPEFTITPADGSVVKKIDVITCSYPGKINPSYNCNAYVYSGEEIVAELSGDNITVNDDNTIATVTLPKAITEPGTYEVVFPNTFFALGEESNGCSSKQQSVTLTIGINLLVDLIQALNDNTTTSADDLNGDGKVDVKDVEYLHNKILKK